MTQTLRVKTKAFALAAAFVVALIVSEVASRPAAQHLDDSEGEVAAATPTLRSTNRTRWSPRVERVQHATHGERFEAIPERPEPMRSTQDGGIGGDPPATPRRSDAPDGMPPEAPSIYPYEPSAAFRQWRRDWADEAPDPTWAEHVRREFPQRTGSPATTFHQFDCRETICQLYLRTDNAHDAQAIIASLSEDQLEFEQIGDYIQLETAPIGGTLYEVLVRRDRPASMPPHVPVQHELKPSLNRRVQGSSD